jgi:acetoin utilization deacetylase AcuC-like enzyme
MTPAMRAYSPDAFAVSLPAYHRFPMGKYELLRRRVAASGIARLCDPPAASDEEILRAHDREYLDKLVRGEMTRDEEQALGLPWSPELVLRARYSVGCALAACRSAFTEGIAVSLAGGTHHAHRNRGQGYCVFNDGAIAARAMQAEGRAVRVLIADCDVHQGDGTAAILEHDDTVFTFSIHAAGNYPFEKKRSDLDVALPDRAGDAQYMEALAPALEEALGGAPPARRNKS